MKKAAAFAVSLVCLVTIPWALSYGQANSENLTIVTYYPSPMGSFADLDAANSIAVGPIPATRNQMLAETSLAAGHQGVVYTKGAQNGYMFTSRTGSNTFWWYSPDGTHAYLGAKTFTSPTSNLFGVTNAGTILWSHVAVNDPECGCTNRNHNSLP